MRPHPGCSQYAQPNARIQEILSAETHMQSKTETSYNFSSTSRDTYLDKVARDLKRRKSDHKRRNVE